MDDANSGEPGSEMDISDLTHSRANGELPVGRDSLDWSSTLASASRSFARASPTPRARRR